MSLTSYLVTNVHNYVTSTDVSTETFVGTYDDGADEEQIVNEVRWYAYRIKPRTVVSGIKIVNENDATVKEYVRVQGTHLLYFVPSYVSTDAGIRAQLNEDITEWTSERPFYESTENAGLVTWPSHWASYLYVECGSGPSISAGDLIVYEDLSSPYHKVKVRDSDSEVPLGVALEDIAVGAIGKVAVNGYCDVSLYTETWSDANEGAGGTAGETTGIQNQPIYCCYVEDNENKAIIDGFFGSSSYPMTGYGHLLGTAVSEAGGSYVTGKVRIRLNICPAAKEPLVPMTFGGDAVLWLANYETDAEPPDTASIDDWDDLSPWSNDFNAPTGTREPLYARDSLNRHGGLDFEASDKDNFICDSTDQEFHDNSDGLSIFCVCHQETYANHYLVSRYDSAAGERGWYLKPGQFSVFEDSSTYTTDYSAIWTNSDTADPHLICGIWKAQVGTYGYEDGTLKDTASNACDDIDNTSTETRIGCYRHEQANNFDGIIYEILVVKSYLNTTKRQALENYFNARYKLW